MSHGATDSGLPSPDQVREWLGAAAADPASLPDDGYAALLGADGAQLDELCELADALRQRAAGDDAHLRREPEPRHSRRGRG